MPVGFCVFLRSCGERQEVPVSAVILVPLLPFLAALIVLVGDEGSRHQRAKIAAYPISAAFLGAIATLWLVATQGPITIRFYDPASLAMLAFPMGFYIDRLSAVMMVLIAGVGTIIYTYSIGYMYQDRHDRRYLALIGFTTSVLLCMVSSANLMMLFLFWQVLSYMLYLLAHNHAHAATLEGAFRTFTLLRVGDVAFLSGIVLAYQLYGTLEFQALFAKAAESPVTLTPLPGIEIGGATAVTLLLFIGAMSKSAQFPIHIWLPSSLYAPTPVHALLHAGIINAGGFLINRLAPLYGLSSTTLHVAFVVGTVTAVLGATMMLVQNDIKKTLGFSTIGQMGYMIMECGLGAFSLAVFHLIAHGLFKATIFLNCGHVIHAARQEPRLPPKDETVEQTDFSLLTWLTGFITTLILPLIILLAAHGVLQVPLRDAQGAVIFLFFAWVTSAQAILSLYRLRAVESWKVAGVMVFTMFLVIGTYLWAAVSFTYFLYPARGEAARYFEAAAFPPWLFDLFVVTVTVLIIGGWAVVYTNARGEHVLIPRWTLGLMPRLYMWFWNRLYVDTVYARLGQALSRLARRA